MIGYKLISIATVSGKNPNMRTARMIMNSTQKSKHHRALIPTSV